MPIHTGSTEYAKTYIGSIEYGTAYQGANQVLASDVVPSETTEWWTGEDLGDDLVAHTNGATITTTYTGGRAAVTTSSGRLNINPDDSSPNGPQILEFVTTGNPTELKFYITSFDDLAAANNNVRIQNMQINKGAGYVAAVEGLDVTFDELTRVLGGGANDTPANSGWALPDPVIDGNGYLIPSDNSSGAANFWMDFAAGNILGVKFEFEVYATRSITILVNVEKFQLTD